MRIRPSRSRTPAATVLIFWRVSQGTIAYWPTIGSHGMSPRLIDHFQNPRNVGELPPPALAAEASNPVCGDVLRLSAHVVEQRIVKIRYKVRGCAASIAAGSALTELMGGRDAAAL